MQVIFILKEAFAETWVLFFKFLDIIFGYSKYFVFQYSIFKVFPKQFFLSNECRVLKCFEFKYVVAKSFSEFLQMLFYFQRVSYTNLECRQVICKRSMLKRLSKDGRDLIYLAYSKVLEWFIVRHQALPNVKDCHFHLCELKIYIIDNRW